MKQAHFVLRAAAIGSSVLLVTAFVSYRAGAFSLETPAMVLNATAFGATELLEEPVAAPEAVMTLEEQNDSPVWWALDSREPAAVLLTSIVGPGSPRINWSESSAEEPIRFSIGNYYESDSFVRQFQNKLRENLTAGSPALPIAKSEDQTAYSLEGMLANWLNVWTGPLFQRQVKMNLVQRPAEPFMPGSKSIVLVSNWEPQFDIQPMTSPKPPHIENPGGLDSVPTWGADVLFNSNVQATFQERQFALVTYQEPLTDKKSVQEESVQAVVTDNDLTLGRIVADRAADVVDVGEICVTEITHKSGLNDILTGASGMQSQNWIGASPSNSNDEIVLPAKQTGFTLHEESPKVARSLKKPLRVEDLYKARVRPSPKIMSGSKSLMPAIEIELVPAPVPLFKSDSANSQSSPKP